MRSRRVKAGVAGDGATGEVEVRGAGEGFAGASSFSEIRWAKIESLRRQIAAGTYFVPAEVLAEAMLCVVARQRGELGSGLAFGG